MSEKLHKIGIVGLGLMGTSIIVALLKSGCQVVAITPLPEELEEGTQRIHEQLQLADEMNLLKDDQQAYLKNLSISKDYQKLSSCQLVIECIVELQEVKKTIYQKIEAVVATNCMISSNTSAIPINILQAYLQRPERFMGIHWAEPAYATRFLEITCGEKTDVGLAERVQKEALGWEKEPTLLYKDIRGFITNRLMYAVYRQGFELINQGSVDMAGLDKCFQYDIGSWITIMGIFKRMDYIGLDHYLQSYQQIFPKLANSQQIPSPMQQILQEKGRGIHDLKGLYPHTEQSAKELERNFAVFNQEIYRLADHYRTRLSTLNLAETNETQQIRQVQGVVGTSK